MTSSKDHCRDRTRTKPIEVILFGVGALGSLLVDCLATGYPLIRVVGAVDTAPTRRQRDSPSFIPTIAVRRTWWSGPLEEVLAELGKPADLIYHMTESRALGTSSSSSSPRLRRG